MALSFQDSVNKQKLLKNVENEVSTEIIPKQKHYKNRTIE